MQQFLKNGYMNDNMIDLLNNATTFFFFLTNGMGLQTIFKEIHSACA